jgi:uncharacterized protein YegP (UPF0339 family)
MGFEIYKDKRGEWRWRLRASNGQLVAISEEGFASKQNVIRTLESVRKNAAEAEGYVEVGTEDAKE